MSTEAKAEKWLERAGPPRPAPDHSGGPSTPPAGPVLQRAILRNNGGGPQQAVFRASWTSPGMKMLLLHPSIHTKR
ncbi:hypothetical protein ColTof4_06910 [Colletotrichum tofieldiae]|nr:hypothetical protein ColTof4_06910 [Colletotrichum tofieldiae]